MKKRTILSIIVLFLISITTIFYWVLSKSSNPPEILAFTVNPKLQNIVFYWKNDQGKILNSIGNLKQFVESKNLELEFATNGGMFDKSFHPLGLYIENKKIINPLNTFDVKPNENGEIPNFYLKPNGIFYITSDNKATICPKINYSNNDSVKFATQSGPMLVINGKINDAFKKGSKNYNIRNGVGILPDNKVIFAMSKSKINFFNFATFFKNKGCKNALFFDGYVSRTYLPEQNWKQTDGEFGVIIGVSKTKKVIQ